MSHPLSFSGRIGRVPYALSSAAVFFSQHLAVILFLQGQGIPLSFDFVFLFSPLRLLVTGGEPSDALLILAFAYLLLAAWMLAALAFRRAAEADVSEWIAAAALVPVVQVAVILFLSVAPPKPEQVAPTQTDVAMEPAAAVQGIVAGIGLTLFAVAVGTLLFGLYSYGLFVVSPFVIGAITAYFVNRNSDIGTLRTMRLVTAALALGGIALVVTALEGILCIALAAPLALGIALVGGLLGRAIALRTRRSARETASGFALLPLVFALEAIFPPLITFETEQTVMIDAPSAAVWRAILHMETMEEPQALPFRLGMAYPVRGDVIGEGVGATRTGEFSTGTAIERVTEWQPGRKLAFAVVKDVPAMEELSPYGPVRTPHVIGYFRTTYTSFEVEPQPAGGSRVIERTAHELRLDPVFYWLPLARWIVHENNARVLAHLRHQAMRSVRSNAL